MIISRIMALLFIIILLPILFIIYLVVFFDIKGNPIFIQKRGITAENSVLNIYKFRTIRLEKEFKILSSSNLFERKLLQKNISSIGKFLRKTGLDELPQLFNILKGEMVFIGPRPLPYIDFDFIKKSHLDFYQRRNLITSKPGITGPWQLYGNKNNGIIDLIKYDELFENNKTSKLKLSILFVTILKVITTQHNDSILIKEREGNASINNLQTVPDNDF